MPRGVIDVTLVLILNHSFFYGLFPEKNVSISVFSRFFRLLSIVVCPAMGNYDKIMRENLGELSQMLIGHLLPVNVESIIPIPPRVRKTVIEKETDNLFLIKTKEGKQFIFHLEFQSTNDAKMIHRMVAYDYGLAYAHKLEVVSIVIYVGNRKMKMKNILANNGNYYSFRLIDIRDLDPELFLHSDNPKEIIFAFLAEKSNDRIILLTKKIITKLQQLTGSESELLELLKQLELISLLRGVETQKQIIKQKETMPIIIDIRKDLRFKQGKLKGEKLGRLKGEKIGIELATKERNTAFATYLLKNTTHSIHEIASLVNVPVEFVTDVRDSLNLQ